MTEFPVTAACYNQAALDFVLIELELGITFCKVGLTTKDFVRAERNADNARVALKTVLRMKDRMSFNDRQNPIVCSKTSILANLLVQLERRLTLFTV